MNYFPLVPMHLKALCFMSTLSIRVTLPIVIFLFGGMFIDAKVEILKKENLLSMQDY